MLKNNMRDVNMNKWIAMTRIVATMFIILLLTACGGGGGEDGTPVSDVGSGGSKVGGGAGGAGTSYGVATLSWLPPTENTDGSALTNLAGYKIYYGTEEGNYTDVITIENAGISTYVVENLPAGNTYYFVIAAFDSDGLQSEFSTVGSKTIPA
jgi:hypothetical protein